MSAATMKTSSPKQTGPYTQPTQDAYVVSLLNWHKSRRAFQGSVPTGLEPDVACVLGLALGFERLFEEVESQAGSSRKPIQRSPRSSWADASGAAAAYGSAAVQTEATWAASSQNAL